jgi:HprK-related kinase B
MSLSVLQTVTAQLLEGVVLEQQSLMIKMGRCSVRVRSNSSALLRKLSDYFSHIATIDDDQKHHIQVVAIEKESIDLPINYQDWQREPGKSGRKESVYEVNGGRLIKKVRTGMLFLQSEQNRIAVGPCIQNDNQIINFINNQQMNWLQQRGWLNCHAAALVKNGDAYAVAGFSGGGKSTLMLQMLEDPSTQFLSNDRLFIQPEVNQLQAVGVAKMPRINPGTILHNPRLENIIPLAERQKLFALPVQKLWDLEQKYDVDVDTFYGHGRIVNEALLKSFLVLNWQRETTQPLQLKKVQLRERTDLLLAIMKAPGPFFQQGNGQFSTDTYEFDQAAYLKALDLIDVYEATGQIDFKKVAEHYLLQKEI